MIGAGVGVGVDDDVGDNVGVEVRVALNADWMVVVTGIIWFPMRVEVVTVTLLVVRVTNTVGVGVGVKDCREEDWAATVSESGRAIQRQYRTARMAAGMAGS
jgi:hypothetical protein